MLIDIGKKKFNEYFDSEPHPFISKIFLELNKDKVEKLVYLVVDDDNKKSIGLIAGIKGRKLLSPFSAPFGGFYYKNDKIYTSEIDIFLNNLKFFMKESDLKGFKLILPPGFYHESFNTKMINSLIRNNYKMSIPEITSYVDLEEFTGVFSDRNTRNYYNQAVRNELVFLKVEDENRKEKVYDLIVENRKRFDRPIYMTFNDIIETGKLFETDFFEVNDKENNLVASGIYYRFNKKISYAVFWGDNEKGRPLRAMDYLSFNIWNFYKSLGYKIIDLGTSTESGIPNEGLLRFKETHNCKSLLRFSFEWKPSK